MPATTPTDSSAPTLPEGFKRARIGGDFLSFVGPLYARLDGDRVTAGFRVEPRHCNPMKICHGGMLATFADMLIPFTSMYRPNWERRFLPTVSLQVDYLGPAALGAWVQGEGQMLRTTRNLVFGQGLVTADGEPCFRMSGVFKIGPMMGDPNDRDPLGLRDGASA